MTRQTIVAGNWKMNGNLSLLSEMAECLNNSDIDENINVVICPSFPYLLSANSAFTRGNIAIGAQNMSEFASGAHTGEVSADMLNEMSVKYVILGHSERRSNYGESNEQTAAKVKASLAAGLIPILCIGESEDERVSEQTEAVLKTQLQPVIDAVGIDAFNDIVIAYEPVWAIGTGKTASPEMAQETHAFIRRFFAELNEGIAAKLPLLYGGSMNAKNCKDLIAQPDIDGGLIGGASLKVGEFSTICTTVKG